MIHTIKLYFPLEHYDVIEIQRRFSISYEQLNEYFNAHFSGRFNGVTLSISNRGNLKWKLYMFVDAIKLLGKHNLSESDCSLLENEIKLVLNCLFQHFGYYQDHVLQRIDYRYDVVVPKNERELLLHIYQKLTKSYRYQVKYLGTIDDSGEFKKYETTVYHSSKSVQSVVYSKEDERIAKSQPIEEYEKDVLRFEVRIDKSHINYMSRQDNGNNRPKKLRDYMKDDVFKEYFCKYIVMSHIKSSDYPMFLSNSSGGESILLPFNVLNYWHIEREEYFYDHLSRLWDKFKGI